MLIINQAHCLATQEILIHVRKQPSAPPKRSKNGPSPGPIEPSDSPTATESSQDSLLSALERLSVDGGPDLVLERDANGDEWSRHESEGPIIATPMGVVRPWPRRGEDGPPGAVSGVETQPLRGVEQPRVAVEELPSARDGRPPVVSGSDGAASGGGISATLIMETPMGVVRPTRLWRWDGMDGTGEEGNTSGQRLEGSTSIELPTNGSGNTDEDIVRTHGLIIQTPVGNVRPTRTGPGKQRTGTMGDAMTKSAKHSIVSGEGDSDLGNESPTKTPAGKTPSRDAVTSTASEEVVDRFLANNRKLADPPAGTNPPCHRPPSLSFEDSAAAFPTNGPNDLRNITTLTLLTEDVHGLTAFYVTALGASPIPASSSSPTTPFSITLAFTPHLSIRLLHSRVARARAIFGDDVIVGRQAATPTRVMLGVEVRDVDAVWRRLRDLGHGEEASDDGREALGEVRTVGARRSVCFVDLAGHCWEAWQRVVRGGALSEEGLADRGRLGQCANGSGGR